MIILKNYPNLSKICRANSESVKVPPSASFEIMFSKYPISNAIFSLSNHYALNFSIMETTMGVFRFQQLLALC